MRLICPNCDAQYEVDDGVIPDTGRDVQCSACGHTWFHPGAGMDAAGAGAENAPLPDAASWEGVVPEAAALPAAGEDEDEDEDGGGNTPLSEPAPEQDAARRMLDENLLSILREEAEHEARARKAEGSSLETQPELGLSAVPAALAARAAASLPVPEEHAAQLRPDPVEALNDPGPRRDRLPDIEVINSSLRAASERGADLLGDAADTRARRSTGFRFGFLLVVVVAAAGAWAYMFADRLGEAVPELRPALGEYTRQVDAGRFWLDAQMRAVTERLRPKR
jgi:predicted Zn finger-like uncharacterized protein